MSEELKERAGAARKSKNRCTAFKWAAIASGATAIVIFVLAAIFPPPWEVKTSILQGMGICVGIQALFEAMVALEAGADAKVNISKNGVDIKTDADGNGKTPD